MERGFIIQINYFCLKISLDYFSILSSLILPFAYLFFNSLYFEIFAATACTAKPPATTPVATLPTVSAVVSIENPGTFVNLS